MPDGKRKRPGISVKKGKSATASGASASDVPDAFRSFLVTLATDPARLGAFIKNPDGAMRDAGIGADDQAVLKSGDPGAIHARLSGRRFPISSPTPVTASARSAAGDDQPIVRPSNADAQTAAGGMLMFPNSPVQLVPQFPQLPVPPMFFPQHPQLVMHPFLQHPQIVTPPVFPQGLPITPPIVHPQVHPQVVVHPQVFPQVHPQVVVHPQIFPQVHPQVVVHPQIFPQVHPQVVVHPQIFPQVHPQVVVHPQIFPQVHPQVVVHPQVFPQIFPQLHPQLVTPGSWG